MTIPLKETTMTNQENDVRDPFKRQMPPEPELIRYVKLTLDGQSVILEIDEIADWVQEEMLNNDPGTVYTIEPVDMTLREKESLPEYMRVAFSAVHERPSFKDDALKKHPGAVCRRVEHPLLPNGHGYIVTLASGREYGETTAAKAWERVCFIPPPTTADEIQQRGEASGKAGL